MSSPLVCRALDARTTAGATGTSLKTLCHEKGLKLESFAGIIELANSSAASDIIIYNLLRIFQPVDAIIVTHSVLVKEYFVIAPDDVLAILLAENLRRSETARIPCTRAFLIYPSPGGANNQAAR